jgi:hypothetical protein
MGTPTLEEWPTMKDLPEYKEAFPVYPGVSLPKVVKRLEPAGVDLLQVRYACSSSLFLFLTCRGVILASRPFSGALSSNIC